MKTFQFLLGFTLLAFSLEISATSQNLEAASFKTCAMDPSSYSNCDEIQTQHFQLDIQIDFDQSIFKGTNTLTMKAAKGNVTQVILDYQGIIVSKVEQQLSDVSWSNSNFTLQTGLSLGNALIVTLNETLNKTETTTIRVTYETTKEASATSWLTEQQTASKTLKYLYTQCQSIYCRSVAPLQDTPSIKSTYQANVKVKKPYVVKMAANETNSTDNGDGTTTYHFHNDIKVPSYLLAIAAGNITQQKIGTRTWVVSEPNVLPTYASQLENLELALNASEEYMTPYIWGTYKILVLPPSFPYGGMENPLLTFASPSIVIGDKLQVVAVPTHEIAHSWTGNEVTCKDWSNIWLNEGFTVFIERKVNELRFDEDFVKIEAQLGNTSMWVDMINLGINNSYNSLLPDLSNGQNPDEALTGVPYEKGYQFVAYLESIFNTKADFQDVLRTYIKAYSQQSVTYLDFKAHLETWVKANYSEADQTKVLGAINWDAWVLQPGYNPPEAKLNFTTESALKFDKLADDYIAFGGDASPTNFQDYLNASNTILKVLFFNRLEARTSEITYKILSKIDSDLNVTLDPSPEIGQRWFPLALEHQYYNGTLDMMHLYLGQQGRIKYINPVYTALVKNGRRDLAYKWFNEYQNFYHPIALAGVRKIILMTDSEIKEYRGHDNQSAMLLRRRGIIY